jgi:biotin-(acetyl-CoA carboxylase) ligase
VDREILLSSWLARLAPLYGQLLAGRFDGRRWADAQVTTAADVTVETGGSRLQGRAVGVDIESGALLVLEPASGEVRSVGVGEVVACIVGGSARPL